MNDNVRRPLLILTVIVLTLAPFGVFVTEISPSASVIISLFALIKACFTFEISSVVKSYVDVRYTR